MGGTWGSYIIAIEFEGEWNWSSRLSSACLGEEIMAVETIDYNGYRLEVIPVGKGWRVCIYLPGSTLALRESPSILEKVPKEIVIAEAKKIVDARTATN